MQVADVVEAFVNELEPALGPTVDDWDRAADELEAYADGAAPSALHETIARAAASEARTGAERLRAAAWRL